MKTKYISLVLLVLSFLACTPTDEKELIGGGGPIISSPLGNVTTHGRLMVTLNIYPIRK